MIKTLAAQLLPPIITNRIHASRVAACLRRYERCDGRPWSPGYVARRSKVITEALQDDAMMERFRKKESLPEGYGVGIDERIVEYPWFLSNAPTSGLFLDAGSTLNHRSIMDQFLTPDRTLHILTLSPESECHWQRGVSYLYGDLRHILARDGFYDTVACISTLEHVGFDNTRFNAGKPVEGEPDDYLAVMQEFSRVLKPGGSLFLSVPYGRYQNHGTFQQFDRARIERAVAAFGPAECSIQLYRYSSTGWNTGTESDCASAEYVSWVAALPPQSRARSQLQEVDRAAAARAVACLHLIKR